ncbi:hypothetical protein PHYBLDRAFT_71424 [Phycomyces blakesleeanus NRRL 1555(-)]|uniref:Uncharacterized protein n=1 Tax=Phycomyces blakesleeanus (strain ATCC 8743b / DSM 1359 / FGSC 10004 / NBRC 33097 / NRRL 1555) TaxID=763407 RepID=A0A162PMM1_PHYB8|nr:hypothetical protein PHYBLDRAFT_71424 [Phycomyces blakesleeanus NRRL 1555(-)]OAD74307.1 hypothetical protein PHYBLDRAFT_71424 [Phycomyces blakesleeanus NRRL 1555(-)]|eukprot:XP_018292347.1 hypothetical protein PHYBLDRAFT_71424 [Phycomyces blakesleeanus NRRL 1555(-)]
MHVFVYPMQIHLIGIAENIILSFSLTLRFSSNQYLFTTVEIRPEVVEKVIYDMVLSRVRSIELSVERCSSIREAIRFGAKYVSDRMVEAINSLECLSRGNSKLKISSRVFIIFGPLFTRPQGKDLYPFELDVFQEAEDMLVTGSCVKGC